PVRLRPLRRGDGARRRRGRRRGAGGRGAGERPRAGGVPGPVSAAPAILDISSLHAGYGRYDVVRDLDLHIAEGEAVALLGPNGAGKTTVLRSIMGLVKHRRGSIRIDGRELVRMPTHRIARGHAALVPEGRRLFLDQSVEDNLLLGALHLRRDRRRVRELLGSVYELFPFLQDVRTRSSSALSGGQQQIVAIARMLMSD